MQSLAVPLLALRAGISQEIEATDE